ncbi:MAG: hypothetical protein OXT67_10700 [Zetaproteobacteria bacterium]|nr:hypothetical protein [Zetaproteobacteria bacterium]
MRGRRWSTGVVTLGCLFGCICGVADASFQDLRDAVLRDCPLALPPDLSEEVLSLEHVRAEWVELAVGRRGLLRRWRPSVQGEVRVQQLRAHMATYNEHFFLWMRWEQECHAAYLERHTQALRCARRARDQLIQQQLEDDHLWQVQRTAAWRPDPLHRLELEKMSLGHAYRQRSKVRAAQLVSAQDQLRDLQGQRRLLAQWWQLLVQQLAGDLLPLNDAGDDPSSCLSQWADLVVGARQDLSAQCLHALAVAAASSPASEVEKVFKGLVSAAPIPLVQKWALLKRFDLHMWQLELQAYPPSFSQLWLQAWREGWVSKLAPVLGALLLSLPVGQAAVLQADAVLRGCVVAPVWIQAPVAMLQQGIRWGTPLPRPSPATLVGSLIGGGLAGVTCGVSQVGFEVWRSGSSVLQQLWSFARARPQLVQRALVMITALYLSGAAFRQVCWPWCGGARHLKGIVAVSQDPEYHWMVPYHLP